MKGGGSGFSEVPSAAWKACLRGMDRFTFLLVLIIGHIEIYRPTCPICIVCHYVVAEFEYIKKLLFHIFPFTLPFTYLHGKLTEWFCNGHFLPELNSVGQSESEQ